MPKGPNTKLVDPCILTINGGSSSIKFALYQTGAPLTKSACILKRGLSGSIDRIGLSGTSLTFDDPAANQQDKVSLSASDHKSAVNFLLDWLEKQNAFQSIKPVGHP